MTQANDRAYLGLTLPEAIARLLALGITPSVTISSAPRRLENSGEFRVVRQSADGGRLVVCAFQTRVREDVL